MESVLFNFLDPIRTLVVLYLVTVAVGGPHIKALKLRSRRYMAMPGSIFATCVPNSSSDEEIVADARKCLRRHKDYDWTIVRGIETECPNNTNNRHILIILGEESGCLPDQSLL